MTAVEYTTRQTKISYWLFITVAAVGLYLTTKVNYLLFHSLSELFSIIVAVSIFIITWNSARYIKNPYLMTVGVSYLFIGILDLLHTLAYKGMPIFTDYDYYANQLWIAARFMESVTLLIAFLLLLREKQVKAGFLFGGYAVVTTLFIASIFYWKIFPICFVADKGLTAFKIYSEYAICFILAAALMLLTRNKNKFIVSVYRLLYLAIVYAIISELAFTFYIDNYGFSNLVGHYFKIFSFIMTYQAIISTGIDEPYRLVFRELSQTNDSLRTEIELRTKVELELENTLAALQRINMELEKRVAEQTAEIRQAYDAVRSERQLFLDMLDTLPVIIDIIRSDHRIEWANRAYRQALGNNEGQLCYESQFGLKKPCEECQAFTPLQTCQPHQWEWTLPNDRTFEIHNFPFTAADGSPAILEMDIDVTDQRRAERSLKELNATLEHRVAERTTELRESEEALRSSLQEKEILLKEIHHRVKNNMQVISSLVSMQADNLTDKRIREELDDIRNRICSMALVHEKLYQTENLAQIDFADYSASMLRTLWRSHGNLSSKIRLNFEVIPLMLPVDTAIPCGLILNELSVNVLKHAFPGSGIGEVTVSLQSDSASNTVSLRVRDNGVGLPVELDWRQSPSLGLRLVQILTGQIRGTVKTGAGPGADFQVTFPWTV